MRVIGSDTTLSAHMIQIFPNLPAEMSCVSWVSCGPPVYGVYIPVSNDCINVSEAYGANQPANESGVFDTDNYPYYVFKDLCTRCVGPENYKIYGQPVQAYWHEAESNMFSGMSKVIEHAQKIKDNNSRASYITSYCNDMQTKAFKDGKQMLNDVVWTQSKDSNTFKIERNPETHQMTGEKVVIPPMEVKLNASEYGKVP
jgi:dipeptidase